MARKDSPGSTADARLAGIQADSSATTESSTPTARIETGSDGESLYTKLFNEPGKYEIEHGSQTYSRHCDDRGFSEDHARNVKSMSRVAAASR